MSYPCTAFELLISSPSDVTPETLAGIRHAIGRWNASMGKATSTVVIPVAWSEDAVAEFGDRPQGLINDQLTDHVDAGIAIFRDRLGSPTGETVSGTWEEIERLDGAGKPVGILRDTSPRPPSAGTSGSQELLRLETHLEQHAFNRALILPSADDVALQNHVQQFLTRFTGQAQRTAEHDQTATSTVPTSSRGVWPRVESSEYVETDTRGRMKTRRRHQFVLSNQTGGPALDVHYEFDLPPGEVFDVLSRGTDDVLHVMPPGGEARFPLALTLGSATRADCRVHWSDHEGQHITEATVTV